MTVLDGLHYIKENLDPSLAWRYSCRMGVCGSCGMLINGRPTLACNTQILHIASDGSHRRRRCPTSTSSGTWSPTCFRCSRRTARSSPTSCARMKARSNDPDGEFYQTPEELEPISSSPTASSAAAAWPPAPRWPPTRVTPGRCRWPRRSATTRTLATTGGAPATGRPAAARRLPLPLRRRVLARLPQGRGPGQGHPASQAPAGAGLSPPGSPETAVREDVGTRSGRAASQHRGRAAKDGLTFGWGGPKARRRCAAPARPGPPAGCGPGARSHAQFVAQAAHALDDARADLAGLLGRKRALGRAHRQPERNALPALLAAAGRNTAARTQSIRAAARRRMPGSPAGLPACSRSPAITERSNALDG